MRRARAVGRRARIRAGARGLGRLLLLLPLLLYPSCAPVHGAAEAAGDVGDEPFLIHFLDVGQGDAVLLRSPSGQSVLYDGGPRSSGALDHLERLGVDSLDLVIASHAHADHITGLIAVMRRHRPRFFMDNGLPHTTLTYRRLLEAVEEAGSLLIEPGERRIALGEAELRVLPLPDDDGWGQNDRSIGLVVTFGAFRATLTGDAEQRQWAWWLRQAPELIPRVQLHKSSHHGSRNGDTADGLARLQPQLVVVGAGENNPYGHPDPRSLARYAAAGAEVLRTDVHGSITVEAFRDGTFRVRSTRGSPRATEAAR